MAHKFILAFSWNDLVYFVLIGTFPTLIYWSQSFRDYMLLVHIGEGFIGLLGLFTLDAVECMILTPVWPRCPLTVRLNVNGL